MIRRTLPSTLELRCLRRFRRPGSDKMVSEPSDCLSAEEIAGIEAALAGLERGEFIEYDVENLGELARDVRARGLKRLADEQG